MPRTHRIQVAGTLYHVMNRGNDKKQLFFDNADYLFFLDILFRFKREYTILLYALVLMPNHIHLLIEPTADDTLAKFMKRLTQVYAHYFRKKYAGIGHVWQSRYRSIPIESEAYYLRCMRYIELNPVRAKIVKHPRLYKWSSYAIRENNKLCHNLDIHPIFQELIAGDSGKYAYVNFIEEGINSIELQESESFSEQPVYGVTDAFLARFPTPGARSRPDPGLTRV